MCMHGKETSHHGWKAGGLMCGACTCTHAYNVWPWYMYIYIRILFCEHGLYWAYKTVWAVRHDTVSDLEHSRGMAFGVYGWEIRWLSTFFQRHFQWDGGSMSVGHKLFLTTFDLAKYMYSTCFGSASRYARGLYLAGSTCHMGGEPIEFGPGWSNHHIRAARKHLG
jgi:hypothetical protein